MKVLHAIPSLQQGGAERLVLDIARGLDAAGIDVRVVYFHAPNAYAEAYPDVEPRLLNEDFALRFLRGVVQEPHALNAYLEDFQPDVVHSHLFAAELRTRSCAYRPKLWVSHLHDNMRQIRADTLPRNRQTLVERYERAYVLKRYKDLSRQRFVSISKDTSAYFKQHLPKRLSQHMVLLPNAIDVARFRPSGEHPVDCLRMCNIGSFQAKKNQRLLIETAAILQGRLPFELHFFGDGPLRKEVEAASEQAGLNGQVFFHGNVPRVERELQRMNLYVHSATYEPFGLVLLEAMAAHLPVVCLNGRGNADFIEHRKNASMVEDPVPEDLARAILEVWNDPVQYARYQKNGAATAEAYGMTAYIQKLIGYYQAWLSA